MRPGRPRLCGERGQPGTRGRGETVRGAGGGRPACALLCALLCAAGTGRAGVLCVPGGLTGRNHVVAFFCLHFPFKKEF